MILTVAEKKKINGAPAFAGVTVFFERILLTRTVMPAEAGIPFSSVF